MFYVIKYKNRSPNKQFDKQSSEAKNEANEEKEHWISQNFQVHKVLGKYFYVKMIEPLMRYVNTNFIRDENSVP